MTSMTWRKPGADQVERLHQAVTGIERVEVRKMLPPKALKAPRKPKGG